MARVYEPTGLLDVASRRPSPAPPARWDRRLTKMEPSLPLQASAGTRPRPRSMSPGGPVPVRGRREQGGRARRRPGAVPLSTPLSGPGAVEHSFDTRRAQRGRRPPGAPTRGWSPRPSRGSTRRARRPSTRTKSRRSSRSSGSSRRQRRPSDSADAVGRDALAAPEGRSTSRHTSRLSNLAGRRPRRPASRGVHRDHRRRPASRCRWTAPGWTWSAVRIDDELPGQPEGITAVDIGARTICGTILRADSAPSRRSTPLLLAESMTPTHHAARLGTGPGHVDLTRSPTSSSAASSSGIALSSRPSRPSSRTRSSSISARSSCRRSPPGRRHLRRLVRPAQQQPGADKAIIERTLK